MEDQVTSLKISKQLKEAGFERQSSFWWILRHDGKYTLGQIYQPLAKSKYPAYTFQQLWEVLPMWFGKNRDYFWEMTHVAVQCIQLARPKISVKRFPEIKGLDAKLIKSFPDTVAQAVLWCIKEGYIKLDKKK